jgi:flagellin-like hook-associated protein FlgL
MNSCSDPLCVSCSPATWPAPIIYVTLTNRMNTLSQQRWAEVNTLVDVLVDKARTAVGGVKLFTGSSTATAADQTSGWAVTVGSVDAAPIVRLRQALTNLASTLGTATITWSIAPTSELLAARKP